MEKSYVPVYKPAQDKARILCEKANAKTQQEKFDAITKWLNHSIYYDGVREIHLKELTGPDVERCYEKRMGVCMDIACLAACMFRAVDIHANIVFGEVSFTDYRGTFGPNWHAWCEVYVDGNKVLYDQIAEKRNLNRIKTRNTYTYKVSHVRK